MDENVNGCFFSQHSVCITCPMVPALTADGCSEIIRPSSTLLITL